MSSTDWPDFRANKFQYVIYGLYFRKQFRWSVQMAVEEAFSSGTYIAFRSMAFPNREQVNMPLALNFHSL